MLLTVHSHYLGMVTNGVTHAAASQANCRQKERDSPDETSEANVMTTPAGMSRSTPLTAIPSPRYSTSVMYTTAATAHGTRM